MSQPPPLAPRRPGLRDAPNRLGSRRLAARPRSRLPSTAARRWLHSFGRGYTPHLPGARQTPPPLYARHPTPPTQAPSAPSTQARVSHSALSEWAHLFLPRCRDGVFLHRALRGLHQAYELSRAVLLASPPPDRRPSVARSAYAPHRLPSRQRCSRRPAVMLSRIAHTPLPPPPPPVDRTPRRIPHRFHLIFPLIPSHTQPPSPLARTPAPLLVNPFPTHSNPHPPPPVAPRSPPTPISPTSHPTVPSPPARR
jgi:hypothetical protein